MLEKQFSLYDKDLRRCAENFLKLCVHTRPRTGDATGYRIANTAARQRGRCADAATTGRPTMQCCGGRFSKTVCRAVMAETLRCRPTGCRRHGLTPVPAAAPARARWRCGSGFACASGPDSRGASARRWPGAVTVSVGKGPRMTSRKCETAPSISLVLKFLGVALRVSNRFPMLRRRMEKSAITAQSESDFAVASRQRIAFMPAKTECVSALRTVRYSITAAAFDAPWYRSNTALARVGCRAVGGKPPRRRARGALRSGGRTSPHRSISISTCRHPARTSRPNGSKRWRRATAARCAGRRSCSARRFAPPD